MILSFSTGEIRPSDKHTAWCEKLSAFIGDIDLKPYSGEEFDAEYQLGGFGFARLAKMSFGPITVRRTQEMIHRHDRHYLNVLFQLQGHALLEQNGMEVWLSPGDWIVYDLSRPYKLSNPEQNLQLGMLVPRDEAVLKGLNPAHYLGRKFSAKSGLGKIAFEFLLSLHETISTPTVEPGLYRSNMPLELLRLAILDNLQPGEWHSVRDMLRERIKTYVSDHIRDANLSVESIAAAMKCTKRYLHKIFADDDMTLSQYIWEARLQGCHDSLLDPKLAGQSITEVAFSWGFNNSAHFSHRFKTQFGVSPTSYRLANDARTSRSA